jgi:hypothetical protein
MGLSNNEILLRLGIVIAFVVMLPGALLFALGLDPSTMKRAVNHADGTLFEERALAIAENEYQGTARELHGARMTMGELGAIECSPLGAIFSMVVDAWRGNLNWCDPGTEVWVVDMKGEFHLNGVVTRSLSIVLDGKGKLVRVGTAAMLPDAKGTTE